MSDPVASVNFDTGANSGSGRIKVITEPALPAICVLCRRSADGIVKFIDFQFDLDYYGAVVFCEDCMKEVLHELEYVPRTKLQEVVDLLTHTVEELEVANSELDRYKSALDSLSFIRPDIIPAVLANDVGTEDAGETSGSSEQSDSGSEQDESDSDGSDSVGGSEDFSLFAD